MEKIKLQLALDVLELNDNIINICEEVKEYVDIYESGTLLCLSEGMKAVQKLKKKFPEHLVLADIRIVKAGKVLSELAYKNGADIITVMSDADEETLKSVFQNAQEYNGEIQIEINNKFSKEQLELWKKYKIKKLIVHRHSELTNTNNESNDKNFMKILKQISESDFSIGITGGIKIEEIKNFKNLNVSSFIIGREIAKTENPREAARKFKEEIKNINK